MSTFNEVKKLSYSADMPNIERAKQDRNKVNKFRNPNHRKMYRIVDGRTTWYYTTKEKRDRCYRKLLSWGIISDQSILLKPELLK